MLGNHSRNNGVSRVFEIVGSIPTLHTLKGLTRKPRLVAGIAGELFKIRTIHTGLFIGESRTLLRFTEFISSPLAGIDLTGVRRCRWKVGSMPASPAYNPHANATRLQLDISGFSDMSGAGVGGVNP